MVILIRSSNESSGRRGSTSMTTDNSAPSSMSSASSGTMTPFEYRAFTLFAIEKPPHSLGNADQSSKGLNPCLPASCNLIQPCRWFIHVTSTSRAPRAQDLYHTVTWAQLLDVALRRANRSGAVVGWEDVQGLARAPVHVPWIIQSHRPIGVRDQLRLEKILSGVIGECVGVSDVLHHRCRASVPSYLHDLIYAGAMGRGARDEPGPERVP